MTENEFDTLGIGETVYVPVTVKGRVVNSAGRIQYTLDSLPPNVRAVFDRREGTPSMVGVGRMDCRDAAPFKRGESVVIVPYMGCVFGGGMQWDFLSGRRGIVDSDGVMRNGDVSVAVQRSGDSCTTTTYRLACCCLARPEYRYRCVRRGDSLVVEDTHRSDSSGLRTVCTVPYGVDYSSGIASAVVDMLNARSGNGKP